MSLWNCFWFELNVVKRGEFWELSFVVGVVGIDVLYFVIVDDQLFLFNAFQMAKVLKYFTRSADFIRDSAPFNVFAIWRLHEVTGSIWNILMCHKNFWHRVALIRLYVLFIFRIIFWRFFCIFLRFQIELWRTNEFLRRLHRCSDWLCQNYIRNDWIAEGFVINMCCRIEIYLVLIAA